MADAYWRYVDGRQQPAALPPHVGKRPRSDFELLSGHDMSGYYDERAGHRVIRDTDSVNASYERYLRSAQISLYGSEAGRSMSGGLGGHHHVDDPRVIAMGGSDPSLSARSRNTLFVEGLAANCTRREVSHIFRPFVGYKEVRLVTKEPRHPGGDPLVLCFVDFQSPAHAATAMDALQVLLPLCTWSLPFGWTIWCHV
ncbi:hypothetical protein Pfo_014635 [Paulownia fortunei]|nr:hypothetical protein Pfo_014635 [Paulownia fortunei]